MAVTTLHLYPDLCIDGRWYNEQVSTPTSWFPLPRNTPKVAFRSTPLWTIFFLLRFKNVILKNQLIT